MLVLGKKQYGTVGMQYLNFLSMSQCDLNCKPSRHFSIYRNAMFISFILVKRLGNSRVVNYNVSFLQRLCRKYKVHAYLHVVLSYLNLCTLCTKLSNPLIAKQLMVSLFMYIEFESFIIVCILMVENGNGHDAYWNPKDHLLLISNGSMDSGQWIVDSGYNSYKTSLNIYIRTYIPLPPTSQVHT